MAHIKAWQKLKFVDGLGGGVGGPNVFGPYLGRARLDPSVNAIIWIFERLRLSPAPKYTGLVDRPG